MQNKLFKKGLVFPLIILLMISSFTPMVIGQEFGLSNDISTDWEQLVDNGFGNEHNIFAWSMKAYKGYLYLGTLNYVDGCQIYRSTTGDKDSWEQVNLDNFDM